MKWKKTLSGYGRRICPTVLWFVTACICFGLVFYLNEIPIGAALYAMLLSSVFGLIFLIFDFGNYLRHERILEQMLTQKVMIPEELPDPCDSLEETYQEILSMMERNQRQVQNDWETVYGDMMDYYSIWVHQIKTPIAAMNLILQTEEHPDRRALSMELFKIRQYTEMVLQYLRLGSSTNDFVFRECSLDDLMRQVIRKYAGQFIGKKLSLEFTETNRTVVTDEKWISFVFEQILSNALKYTSHGKISIFPADQNGITIKDTGIGISREDLPRIFEKGYTGFNGRTDKRATGIGLYLTKMICDRLSCRMEVDSEAGKGTTVTICFPK